MSGSFDVKRVRQDFPLLTRWAAGGPIIYFDNAATSLKPQRVIDAMTRYMVHYTANIHRGNHTLAQEASIAYEQVREKAARFLRCSSHEVIFVRGATEGINLVAAGMNLQKDENVVGTLLEHHSNILPWKSRCGYRAVPLLPSGLPDLDAASSLIDGKTRLLAITSCSNVTGVYVPVRPWAELAHRYNLPLLVDAAQSGAHRRLDVSEMDCDFLVLSGHKMCGPTGAGVLYGKERRLMDLEPVFLGGGTVTRVRPDYTYDLRDVPWRFEAGTPDIAAVLGFGAAIDYLEGIGFDAIERQMVTLRKALVELFESIDGIRVLHSLDPGTPRACIVSFTGSSGTFPPDYLSRILSDTFGIMARSGHHCAHPLHDTFGIEGSLRVSLLFYNTPEEISYLGGALKQIRKMTGTA
ncbi:MAG TPA: cysteine desulfurase [Syntrophales bacterium]|nr:cysteine desulfurase [Syntrophales bacterium]